MRTSIIAGNWKMNNNQTETVKLIAEIRPLVAGAKCDVVVCVPFTDLSEAKKALSGSGVALGAQNVAWADKGAFTGEISADMLLECGVEYVIIGHSERRQYFGETDETVAKRTVQALNKGLKAIVCVGETEDERNKGLTNEVNLRQITKGLNGVTKEQMANVIIAYEPVWAIGTGRTATKEDANEAIAYIRGVVSNMFDSSVADALRIQYGGSMNAANCAELNAMPDIDGGLIGGASLKAADFAAIVKSAK